MTIPRLVAAVFLACGVVRKEVAMAVTVGTAPVSWGVWFPSHDAQPPWSRFLDEAAEAGYRHVELGPLGYLPTEPHKLTTEIGARGLAVVAGFIMGSLHVEEEWPALREETARTCELLASQGAKMLIVIPGLYRNLFTGERVMDPQLSEDSWRRLVDTTHRIAEMARDRWGLRCSFHPHAETHVEHEGDVERFLADSDRSLVGLCLDFGHHSYRGGDVLRMIDQYGDRLGHLHLKSVDAEIQMKVERERIPFAKAVELGIFTEPSRGSLDYSAVLNRLEHSGFDGFGIVEQDTFPPDIDRLLGTAVRTWEYLALGGWV